MELPSTRFRFEEVLEVGLAFLGLIFTWRLCWLGPCTKAQFFYLRLNRFNLRRSLFLALLHLYVSITSLSDAMQGRLHLLAFNKWRGVSLEYFSLFYACLCCHSFKVSISQPILRSISTNQVLLQQSFIETITQTLIYPNPPPPLKKYLDKRNHLLP